MRNIKYLASTIVIITVTAGSLSACGTYSERPVATAPAFKELDYVFAPEQAYDMLTMDERISLQRSLAMIPSGSLKQAMILTNQPEIAHSAKIQDLQIFLADNRFEPAETSIIVAEDATPLNIHIRYKVYELPKTCPNWHATGTFNTEDSLASHFGCATAYNLSYQVADPSDLVKGKKTTYTDTETAVRAIQHHYAGDAPAAASASVPADDEGGSTGGN